MKVIVGESEIKFHPVFSQEDFNIYQYIRHDKAWMRFVFK